MSVPEFVRRLKGLMNQGASSVLGSIFKQTAAVGGSVGRWLLLVSLLAGAGNALAQNATNRASVAPPVGIVNTGAGCTAAGGVFDNATGTCTATDDDPIFRLNLSKTAGTATGPTAAGVYSVTYTIAVTNGTAAAGTYGPISDAPSFPDNLQVTGAAWTCTGGCAAGSATGAGPYQLAAANTAIAANTTHTYSLTINFVYTDNTPAPACSANTPGQGLYNRADLPSGAENDTTDNAACVNPPQPPTPQLTLTKTAGAITDTDAPANGAGDVGDTIAYTFAVENTGNVTLTNVNVTDPLLPNLACTAVTLAPGETQTLTCTAGNVYTLTQADVNAGSRANTATGTGTTPNGGTVNDTDDETVTIAGAPQLTLTKTAGAITDTDTPANGAGDVGDTIAYTFAVENTGNITLTNVNVTDPLLPNLACTAVTLAPGETQTLTCTAGNVYTLTQADVNAGSRANTATGTGTTPNGGTVNDTDDETVTIAGAPQLTLTKTAGAITDTDTPANGAGDVGDTIAYTFAVENTGNVTLTNVNVTDPLLPNLACTAVTLAPGETQTLTCTAGNVYTLTQADVNAGSRANTATGRGTTPNGGTVNDTDDETVTIAGAPQLTLTKTAGAITDTDTPANGAGDVGDTIAYTFAVENTGNVTLTNVNVTDPLLPNLACTAVTLAPGETQTLTCTAGNVYTLTQADVNAGSRANTATGAGATPNGGTVNDTDDETVTIAGAPQLSLTKTAGAITDTDTPANGAGDVGDTIAYTFAVENTGNVTLTNVNVADPLLPNLACTAVTLAPGETQTLTCTAGNVYTLTQADVNAGSRANTATGTGTTPNGGTVNDTDDETVTIAGAPQLTLTKTAGAITDTDTPANGAGDVGDTIAYTFAVENTGNVTLTNVNVTDPLLPNLACTAVTLAPGETQTLTCTAGNVYTLTQADVNAGSRANTATVAGATPNGGTVNDTDDETVTIAGAPQLTLTKTAGAITDTDTPANGAGDVGDTITYTFAVENTGNVTLTNVNVTDPLLPNLACTAVTLAPGETQTLTCTAGNVYTLTQADVNAGSRANTAAGTGTTPNGGTVNDTDDETVTIAGAPQLTLTKTAGAITDTDTPANGAGDVGDTVTYTFAVENTGNVTLTDVSVTDPLLPNLACTAVTLAPGETQTLTCTAGNVYTLTQADVNAGSRANTATGAGTTPNGGTVNDTDDETVTIAGAPQLTLTKTAGAITDTDTPANGAGDVGDTVTYTFAVENTGNVTLTNVNVTDPLLPNLACTAVTLAPGETQTLTCTAGNVYTLTQADVNAGSRANTATGTGTTPNGGTVNDTDDETVTITQTADLTSEKTQTTNADEDGSGSITVGDTLSYRVRVTNTGNVTLTDVVVTDDKITPSTITCATVAPGAFCDLVGTYKVQQSDVNTGSIVNKATVATSTPNVCPTGSTDAKCSPTVTVPVTQTADLTSEKTQTTNADEDGSGSITVGDTLSYRVRVTNTGNVTLTDMVVTDDKITPSTITCATVAPGAFCDLVGTYKVQQSDVNTGSIVNKATVATSTPNVCPTGSTDAKCSPTVTVPVTQTADLTSEKTQTTNADEDGSGSITVGDTLSYRVRVTNTGNVTLTDVVVTDDKIAPNTITCATVAPGAFCDLVGTYKVQQSDVNTGSIVNKATVATSTPNVCPTGSTDAKCSPTVTVPVIQTADLTSEKTQTTNADEDGSGSITVDDTLSYRVRVTNTGNVTLTDVVVTDDKITPNTITCATVAPGAFCDLVGTYKVQQSDVNTGSIVNKATVGTSTPNVCPTGSTDAKCSPTVTVPVTQTADLTSEKTQTTNADEDGSGSITVGDTLSYRVRVTNTGNVTLTDVVVTDDKITPNTITCATVAPGAFCDLVGTYKVQQSDVNTGSIVNKATVGTSTPNVCPTGSTDAKCSPTVTVPVTQTADLTSEKTQTTNADEDGSGSITVGDTLSYRVRVTNTGNVTLTDVVVTDDKITPNTVTCATVAPGAFCDLVGSYKVQQSDVNAGSIVNKATVGTSTPNVCPTGSTDAKCNPTVTVPVTQTADLTSEKTQTTNADEDGSGSITVGDTLSYRVRVTSTGNVTLTDVVVTDDKITPNTITCATVAPGAFCDLVGTYKVQQSDVNTGSIVNKATVNTSTPNVCPAGSTDAKCSPTVTVPVTQAADLTSEKTQTTNADEDGSGSITVGDTLSYRVRVTNTGNVTLTDVVVTDDKITPNTITCATVAPGAFCDLVGTYKVQQSDVNAGSIVNKATVATSTPNVCPTGSTDAKCSPTVTVPVTQTADLTSEKTQTSNADEDGSGSITVGDTLSYRVRVTNTGNVTLTDVVVTDDKITPNTITCATVAPGAFCDLVGTYKVQQSDVNAGSIVNKATVATSTPNVCPTGSTDAKCNPTVTVPVTQKADLTSTKALTANADEDGSGSVTAGDTLTYTITVANTGNIALTNLTVSDDKITPNSIVCATVEPGQTCVLTGTYKVTQADANAGLVRNTAVVRAETPPGVPSPCVAGGSDPKCNPTVTVPVTQAPGLTSVKTMDRNADEDGNGAVSVGDTLTYSITVTNTGNVTLADVVVTDDKITPNTITCASVDPGRTCVLTGTYKVVQADVDAAAVVNTATVTTATPNACPAGSTDQVCKPTVTVPIQAHPAVAIVKVATLTVDNATQGVGNVGDVISYAVRITNTGNITLNDMGTSDVLENYAPTQLRCGTTTLAPGASTDCEVYTHTITREEARAGGTLDNVVTVTARYGSVGGGGQTSGTATATGTAIMPVEPEQSTDLVVSKQARPQRVKIGDLVRYTVTVKNVGETDAIDATLVDTPPAGFSLVDGSLQVADRDGQGRLIGNYPVSVDGLDIAAGESASVVYLLRVGAAVRPGSHVNSAYAEDGGKRSNIATATVELVSDPLLDESLLLGTVFDDRDEDRWQDPAELTDLRVQGGFAPGAYIANSTTVDRGDGARPEPDASSPMLHGIALGKIAGRQSDADPVAAHTVTISQLLREPSFSEDFVLTNAQGVTVRMDAAGNTRVERSGDAAKGLTGADPKVERRVAQTEGGYRVDYIVSNRGVDERGIPGVRLASVEGLLIETDQFGRYHLEGVAGGPWERGRNFILKLDPATLPPGSKLTTDNPLVRRLTPGVPVRFDFGVKLPPGEIPGPKKEVEMRIGEVFFDAGSAAVKPAYLPAVENMAAKVREYGGGEVVITANGESEALAMDRAVAVRKALESMLAPDLLKSLQISVRTDALDPRTMVVGFAEWPKLGDVLFDTDQATIKPKYQPLMAKIAAVLDELKGHRVVVTGHTDKRASDQYNIALGMRRAKAVYDAIVAHASPEVRRTLRVDASNDPDAPAGKSEK